MSVNTIGRILRLTTYGESHGPVIGAVLDGCPAGIEFSRAEVQQELDRRRPGQSRFVTQRRESDSVAVQSGVLAATLPSDEALVTTGTPIALQIPNEDQRSRDYDDIARSYRPGHADWVYEKKYGLRDHRGGGRSSARETACRVAAGAIARRILPFVTIRAAIVAIGNISINRDNWSWDEVNRNSFFCPDAEVVPQFEGLLDDTRRRGSSLGALVEVRATGVPVGLGAPVYGKLDADLASALMSINAVKAVEVGDGMAVVGLSGEENNDEMRAQDGGEVEFLSNHSGGILGGISTGQEIICRIAIKPTSSIRISQRTINENNDSVKISTRGRHDPCVGIRAVPIAEAMMALVLADHYLLARSDK